MTNKQYRQEMIKNSNWKRSLAAMVITTFALFLAGSASAGKIVLNNDEWTLSNTGFGAVGSDSGTFALNVADFFTGGGSGSYLVLSNNFGLTQSSLASTMTGAGHSWTVNASLPINLGNLSVYDGIFLAGTVASGAAEAGVLTSYVNGGGNVYLAGGTGNFSSSAAEAAAWNVFLNNFGLGFGAAFNGVGGVVPIASAHPIFDGVSGLYQNNGNPTLDLLALDPDQVVLVTDAQGRGLYAVYESSAAPVPEPATLAVFGLSLVALGLLASRLRSVRRSG